MFLILLPEALAWAAPKASVKFPVGDLAMRPVELNQMVLDTAPACLREYTPGRGRGLTIFLVPGSGFPEPGRRTNYLISTSSISKSNFAGAPPLTNANPVMSLPSVWKSEARTNTAYTKIFEAESCVAQAKAERKQRLLLLALRAREWCFSRITCRSVLQW